MMPRFWYQDAVVYSLDVDTFQDADGDGVGDLAGLRERLDYLQSLGVSALWLQPVHPSGGRDNDYDVVDHYAVDPAIGSLGDFVQLVEAADARGIRVLIDLVVNHTSNLHPWFEQARADASSPFRDFYVWRQAPDPAVEAEPVFPGHQEGVWCWDEEAGAYFLHHFYEFEPDLNAANPRVRDEIFKIADFWLRLGVAGFRVDAAPFLVKKASWADAREHGHWFLRELSQHMRARNPEAILLAESNVDANDYADFFCEGEGVQLPLNFYVNQHLWLALAHGDATPLVGALDAMPGAPPNCAYANWLRNHDELDLGRLTPHQRDAVCRALGAAPAARLYERGIRRRLTPMLGGDEARVAAAFSVLLSLPGVPVILYGDEIGMGDDLRLPERDSVRTPMQWAPSANGGFSTAPPFRCARPPIDAGPHGYPAVNVLDQARQPDSLLHAVERLIRARREAPEMSQGRWGSLHVGTPRILALEHQWHERSMVCLTNLSSDQVVAQLPLRSMILEEVTANGRYPPVETTLPGVGLAPWGFRWFRARRR